MPRPMTLQQLLEAALALPAEQRAELLARLAASVEDRPARAPEPEPWRDDLDRHSGEICIETAELIEWSDVGPVRR